MLIVSLICVLALAAIHYLAGKLVFLEGRPRSIWLSIAGGLSVAFIFVYLLPQLATKQEKLEHAMPGLAHGFLTHHLFALALFGLIAFYGLERIAKKVSGSIAIRGSAPHPAHPVFWVHLSSFILYNVIIGCMLASNMESPQELVLFTVAMALHFIVMDFSFREHYARAYHQKARWMLAAAILLGWGASQSGQISDTVINVAMAFVSGGIILNALKEELPEEKGSQFWPFLLGAIAYTVIAMAYSG